MPSTSGIQTDILIIGAGVAGCIAALALAPDYQVTLIDKQGQPAQRIGECLPPAARRILQHLNLGTLLEPVEPATKTGHLPNLGIQSAWGDDQIQFSDHLRNPEGSGWYLDRAGFERDLRQAALHRGVQGIWPARLSHSKLEKNLWQICIESTGSSPEKLEISARFIIDAGGRQSPFARQQGLVRQQHDKLISCWATGPSQSELQMGLLVSNENGWWYSSPLPYNQRVLAFQTDSDLLSDGMNKDLSLFLQQARTCEALIPLIQDMARQMTLQGTVSANSTHLPRVMGQGWAAIGDAATSFDPLSSQGMFNAMATAMQLAQLLKESGTIEKPDDQKAKLLEDAYCHQIQRIWDYYLKHRTHYYGLEQRWPQSEFWRRRHL